MKRRILRGLAVVFGLLLLMVCVTAWWLYRQVAASLPRVDGEIEVAGLASPVEVDRDELGIPTIRAKNRADLAFAVGFAHGQERFFQMDLLRRNSAGEMAELIGPALLDADLDVRVHRFRSVGKRLVETASDQQRQILEHYARGVNAGLASLGNKPFEYLLLRSEPAPWQPEDSALVMFSMFLDLQGNDWDDESSLAVMHDVLPEPMFDFLAPRGTKWDAPLDDKPLEAPPVPGPQVFDLRKPRSKAAALRTTGPEAYARWRGVEGSKLGSNNWAVAGSRTKDCRAIVADDMHLGLHVPHIWYRASFAWKDDSGVDRQINGVTLPGTPAMVVGSNGHIAWGFTNSEGDWVDLAIVEPDPSDAEMYLTPEGPKPFEVVEEIIKVKGQDDEVLEVVSTIWGPIVDEDFQGRPRALRWVAHADGGPNMGLIDIESATTLEEALRLANVSGSPAQNFVVADDRGHIAWTILGRIPRRVGWDGRLPQPWSDGKCRWDGWLEPNEYPRVVDPPEGRIWTANARVVGGDMLAKLGDGGYDLGARAGQIRDGLRALDKAAEADMLEVQLDDRAVFLTPWRDLLLELLSPEAVKGHPERERARALVDEWGGRAAVDSVGFRIVRSFRREVIRRTTFALTESCRAADSRFQMKHVDRVEGPVWQLATQRPMHLLDPKFETWEALLLASLDDSMAGIRTGGEPLDDCTWGAYNTTRIQHPLSIAVPALGRWLDMPSQPLPGDSENIPRIQAPQMGASQRMAVSPGREGDGYLHMPGGQSGHPMSPHYADSHSAWAEGKPTSFLPGETVTTLTLSPKSK